MAKRGNKKLGAQGATRTRAKGVTGKGTKKGSGDEGDREELMNVTVTMPVEVAQWARVRAAGESDSLARFLGGVLREMMNREATYDTAMMRYLGRGPQELRRDGGEIPRREELR